MNTRQKARWIHAGTASMLVCAVIVLVGGMLLPIRIRPNLTPHNLEPVIAQSAPNDPPQTKPSVGEVQLERLLTLCQRDWRKPLIEKQTASPNTTPSGQPQQVFMNLRLMGTAVEVGHSMALFQKSDGSLGVCVEGGQIEDSGNTIQVVRIVGDQVELQCAGQSQTLVMPRAMLGVQQ